LKIKTGKSPLKLIFNFIKYQKTIYLLAAPVFKLLLAGTTIAVFD